MSCSAGSAAKNFWSKNRVISGTVKSNGGDNEGRGIREYSKKQGLVQLHFADMRGLQ